MSLASSPPGSSKLNLCLNSSSSFREGTVPDPVEPEFEVRGAKKRGEEERCERERRAVRKRSRNGVEEGGRREREERVEEKSSSSRSVLEELEVGAREDSESPDIF